MSDGNRTTRGRRVERMALVLVALVCLSALAAGVVPGVLVDLAQSALLLAFVAVPVVGGLAAIALFVLARRGKLRITCPSLRALSLAGGLLLATLVLLQLSIPRRIAFLLSLPAFEEQLDGAVSSDLDAGSVGHRLGLYSVDRCARDPRGGVYFRVHTGPDGLGPDEMSYGFVYQPNTEGTPFGAKDYRIEYLGDEWYGFSASDDWF